MAAQRKVKARYRTKPLGKVRAIENRSSMDKDTKSLQQEKVAVEKEMFMVYFPHGHSIRVEKSELVRMGYHLTPKLVDMNTGETVDLGGDMYDFVTDVDAVEDPLDDFVVELKDDDDVVDDELPIKKSAGKA